ncbi:GNAT family N-acetyltransferase [Pseudobutyrivibrio xylanivorans]|uniref:Protein N-acetyltransferase, RimJ/RimL family n=1 Tax=Pseudobutyrivibrio xylanivorans DSM 14809 TaxID=1123012 RepID=A0A1M6BML2_PSEXY|nr:GNAT family N-acetyltransferase [Pseudobutyrivibrio xylanivorans]SHI49965.1 Protein N-acetyltransferase, RimJ/RimL family [Pseudobutyrivibrio xylanivorans DSM 14809]
MHIEPFDMKYLNDYFNGFNEEITKYQWPEPFENIEASKDMLQEFMDEMEKGETLFYSVISDDDKFIGSVEMHGMTSDCPELGVWIIENEQRKGFAYAALKKLLKYAARTYDKKKFYYEADIRNEGSMKLLSRFGTDYDIIECDLEETVTDSGKNLKLQGYVIAEK